MRIYHDSHLPNGRVTEWLTERFAPQALEVFELAIKLARRGGRNYIGSEEILLGLIEQDTGIAAKTFKSLNVNLQDVRSQVERTFGNRSGNFLTTVFSLFKFLSFGNNPAADEILLTPRANLVVERSAQFTSERINTEHLLLGLLEEDTPVTRMLEQMGLDVTTMRSQVIRQMNE